MRKWGGGNVAGGLKKQSERVTNLFTSYQTSTSSKKVGATPPAAADCTPIKADPRLRGLEPTKDSVCTPESIIIIITVDYYLLLLLDGTYKDPPSRFAPFLHPTLSSRKSPPRPNRLQNIKTMHTQSDAQEHTTRPFKRVTLDVER